jgi:hypothetical protein
VYRLMRPSSRGPNVPHRQEAGTALCITANLAANWSLRVMCGRRLIDKSFFDIDAALVGCGHVSGLLMRHGWPLALMLCADQVPIVRTHSKMR